MQSPARQSRSFGGVFGPLAQYPGSSYANLLRTAEQPEMHSVTGLLPVQASVFSQKTPGILRMSATPDTHPYTSALLLVDAESNAAVDRRALREVGITQIRVMTSGLLTARLLAGYLNGEETYHPDVLLCHQKLADMQGTHLALLLRKHPRLLGLPILAVVGNVNEAERLKALSTGFSGLLVRPYSHERLNQTLHSLSMGNEEQRVHMGRQLLDTESFDAALRQYELSLGVAGSPEQSFNAGLQHLHSRRWDEAIQAFQRALHQLSLKGEAELGLAAAWRGKGDLKKYCYYLNEAGHTFARATLWHKAKVAYARLLMLDPDATNPFLATAESLVRAARFEEAAEALAQGYDRLPEEVPQRLAQACIFTENPEFSAHKVQRALGATALAYCAEELGARIHEALAEQARVAQARREEMAQWQGERQREEAASLAASATPSSIAPFTAVESFDERGAGIELAEAPTRPARLTMENEGEGDNGATLNVNNQESGQHGEQTQGRTKNHAGQLRGNAVRTTPPLLEPLAPMSEEDAESRLFSSFPGLNEALTVAKVTWKLLRR